MSRLDSFIRRMCAQRDILNTMPPRLDTVPGDIFEFGLGSGRTHDHLCSLFPDRRIIVFENVVCAHIPGPRAEDFRIGDVRDTAARLPDGSAALIHADIETGDATVDRHLATWLPQLVARLLVSGGYAVSGSALDDPRLSCCPLPAGVAPDRYHVVRRD